MSEDAQTRHDERLPLTAGRAGFAKAGAQVFALSQVVRADFSAIEDLRATVTLTDRSVHEATNIDALELAMLLKPSVLEGRRLRWQKFAWFIHNVVGHPCMQLLSLVGAYRLALKVHDDTVPRPLGKRTK